MDSSCLTPEEIKTRFNIVYDTYIKNLGVSAPFNLILNVIMPSVPKMMADKQKQHELLNFMEALAYCIGYKTYFVQENNINTVEIRS